MKNKETQLISSATNAKFKSWKDLTQGSSLKKSEEFLICGEKIISEMPTHTNWTIHSVLYTAKQFAAGKFPKFSASDYFELSSELFKELDILGTNYPLLVAQQKKIEAYKKQSPQGFEVILPLGDPQNLGAALRSGQALGVKKFILTKEAANPYHPKAVKASAGALFTADLVKTETLADFDFSDSSFALDLDGDSLSAWRAPKNFRLLIGEEGQGVPKEFSGKKIKIPMQKGVESLNAQTSLAIIAYEVIRQNS